MSKKTPTVGEAWPLLDDCVELLKKLHSMTAEEARTFYEGLTADEIVHYALANSELLDYVKRNLWPALNREAEDRFHAKGDGKVTEAFRKHPSQQVLHLSTVQELQHACKISKSVADWKRDQLMVDAQQDERAKGLERLQAQLEDSQERWRGEMKAAQSHVSKAYEILVNDVAPPTIATMTMRNNMEQAKAIADKIKAELEK
jgi:hypothetical protein